MGNGIIAFLVAVSAAAWVYAKTMRSSGNNTQNALILAGAAGAFIFIIVLILIGLIPG